MRIIEVANYDDLSECGFRMWLDAVSANAEAHVCLATGGSPEGMYSKFVAAVGAGEVDVSKMRLTKLDEWYGLPMDHPVTSETYLRKHVLGPLRIPDERYLAFNSEAPDPDAECLRIAGCLERRGPFDLCVLGLGRNGHLAINEPDDWLEPEPHYAEMAEDTRRHGMLVGSDVAPTHGITLGMRNLLNSRKVLLLVTGAAKNDALRRLLEGKVSTRLPSSFLHLHADAVCVIDRSACDA